jgi:hypothetical protein
MEFFFDRGVGFVTVRPLFPTATQGCRDRSLEVTGRGVFVGLKVERYSPDLLA